MGVEDEVGEDLEAVEFKEWRSIREVPISQLAIIHLPQWLYWSFVFLVISFVSLEIIDPNINLDEAKSFQFEVSPEVFIFSWISFVPMGFFYAFKLRKHKITPKAQYGIIFITGQFISLIIISRILLIFINGKIEFNPYDNILSFYILFSQYLFLISFLTSGFLLFYVSYNLYWKEIYNLTPLSTFDNTLMSE